MKQKASYLKKWVPNVLVPFYISRNCFFTRPYLKELKSTVVDYFVMHDEPMVMCGGGISLDG